MVIRDKVLNGKKQVRARSRVPNGDGPLQQTKAVKDFWGVKSKEVGVVKLFKLIYSSVICVPLVVVAVLLILIIAAISPAEFKGLVSESLTRALESAQKGE